MKIINDNIEQEEIKISDVAEKLNCDDRGLVIYKCASTQHFNLLKKHKHDTGYGFVPLYNGSLKTTYQASSIEEALKSVIKANREIYYFENAIDMYKFLGTYMWDC